MRQHGGSRLAAPLHTLVSHRDTDQRLLLVGPHIAEESLPERAGWWAFGTRCGERNLGAAHIVFVPVGLQQGGGGKIACLKEQRPLGEEGSIVLEPEPEEWELSGGAQNAAAVGLVGCPEELYSNLVSLLSAEGKMTAH